MMRTPLFLFLGLLVTFPALSTAQGTASRRAVNPVKTAAGSPAETDSLSDTAGTGRGDEASGSAEADSAVTDPLTWSRPDLSYQSGGRRDPFDSLMPEENKDEKKIKGLFNYEKAYLRGIVQADGGAYALAMDGDNYGHVLRENDPVYGGRVARITEDAVYLNIVKYGRAMNIVLRMDTAKKTVRSGDDDAGTVRRPGINLSFGEGQISGSNVAIEDVVVPSASVQTVEETWFGERQRGTVEPGAGAYLLLGPPDNTAVRLPQVLRWTRAPQDSLYTVVVAADPGFTRPVLVKNGLTAPSLLLDTAQKLETDRPLYWKVVATSRTGKQINFRNNLSFRIVR